MNVNSTAGLVAPCPDVLFIFGVEHSTEYGELTRLKQANTWGRKAAWLQQPGSLHLLYPALCSGKDLAEHCGVGDLTVAHQVAHFQPVVVDPGYCSVQHPVSPYSPLMLH